MNDPLLIDVPAEFLTERLVIRAPRAGDGAAVNAAIVESFAELNMWMPWAATVPTVMQSELQVRRAAVEYASRTDLPMLLFSRADDSFVGGTGLHRMDWQVPRFEIGYWIRTPLAGRGLISEAVRSLTLMCFERLGAVRVEIRMDPENARSRAIPERLGFTLEGTLRCDTRGPHGTLRDTCVYAMTTATDLMP